MSKPRRYRIREEGRTDYKKPFSVAVSILILYTTRTSLKFILQAVLITYLSFALRNIHSLTDSPPTYSEPCPYHVSAYSASQLPSCFLDTQLSTLI